MIGGRSGERSGEVVIIVCISRHKNRRFWLRGPHRSVSQTGRRFTIFALRQAVRLLRCGSLGASLALALEFEIRDLIERDDLADEPVSVRVSADPPFDFDGLFPML